MISRGYKKRGVGLAGLRRVRNPILLAKAVLEHGEEDLGGDDGRHRGPVPATVGTQSNGQAPPDVPSAQGHTLIFGEAAEILAVKYGLEMVDPRYFFTQRRWDEHVKGLDKEREGKGLGTWSAEEYLSQGTCGAVALDENGIVCCATSTGGMTNKLTGRIGDTPVVGAGFWAEEWEEDGDPTEKTGGTWKQLQDALQRPGGAISVSESLRGLLADCFPMPYLYTPVSRTLGKTVATTTRSMAASGTGNGDSFMRISAAHTVASVARWKPTSSATAMAMVSGPGGELQRSAADRWGVTGEGEGGMIGIECAVIRDETGEIVEARGEIIQAHNCGGMFRAWIADDGRCVCSVWRETEDDDDDNYLEGWARSYEGVPVDLMCSAERPPLP
jgi:L-asparaginase